MAGNRCTFLHQFDIEKMPDCPYERMEANCNRDLCPFYHTKPNKVDGTLGSKIQIMYKQFRKSKWAPSAIPCPFHMIGLCPYGDMCKMKHIHVNNPPPAPGRMIEWLTRRSPTKFNKFRKILQDIPDYLSDPNQLEDPEFLRKMNFMTNEHYFPQVVDYAGGVNPDGSVWRFWNESHGYEPVYPTDPDPVPVPGREEKETQETQETTSQQTTSDHDESPQPKGTAGAAAAAAASSEDTPAAPEQQQPAASKRQLHSHSTAAEGNEQQADGTYGYKKDWRDYLIEQQLERTEVRGRIDYSDDDSDDFPPKEKRQKKQEKQQQLQKKNNVNHEEVVSPVFL